MKKIISLLSGGVDSTLSTLLIKKKKKYKLIACIFIKTNNKCNLKDEKIAMIISNILNVPFYSINLKIEYKKYIINYIKHNYYKGYTPNPDIICNYKIKFNILLKKINFLKFDFIVTGHYAKIKKKYNDNFIYYNLYEGLDKLKDQSYFLSRLNQKQLSLLKFPLFNYKKKKVRYLVKKYNFINYNKKSSKGVCLLGKSSIQILFKKKKRGIVKIINSINIKTLIFTNKYNFKYNNIIYKGNCKIIGYHNGCYFYTRGQRKGLKIGGFKKPLYIVFTNIKKNIIYVVEGIKHCLLYNNSLFIKKKNMHFINKKYKKILFKYKYIKIYSRYRDKQKLQISYLIKNKKGYIIIFLNYQFCISKGQFLVIQLKNKILGTGIINKYNNIIYE
ncbi:MAG: tRNA methyl transferase PRC-barrel domain-containing protein [Candidatus Shikimatogenerans sp. AspAUS03]|uniref:tRNA methyl transferase PRC-barrel domain-containing protein n=1 Tax=Candidatus Shikimatogenerans sp. AspAUS03 TaxID=3158563 RepID=A0AAU7QS69_9FLAO